MQKLITILLIAIACQFAHAQQPAKPAATAAATPAPTPAAKPAEKTFSADTQARLDALEKQAADLASAKAQVEAAIKANQAEQAAIVWEAAADLGVKPAELKAGTVTIKKNEAGKYVFAAPTTQQTAPPQPSAQPKQ